MSCRLYSSNLENMCRWATASSSNFENMCAWATAYSSSLENMCRWATTRSSSRGETCVAHVDPIAHSGRNEPAHLAPIAHPGQMCANELSSMDQALQTCADELRSCSPCRENVCSSCSPCNSSVSYPRKELALRATVRWSVRGVGTAHVSGTLSQQKAGGTRAALAAACIDLCVLCEHDYRVRTRRLCGRCGAQPWLTRTLLSGRPASHFFVWHWECKRFVFQSSTASPYLVYVLLFNLLYIRLFTALFSIPFSKKGGGGLWNHCCNSSSIYCCTTIDPSVY